MMVTVTRIQVQHLKSGQWWRRVLCIGLSLHCFFFIFILLHCIMGGNNLHNPPPCAGKLVYFGRLLYSLDYQL